MPWFALAHLVVMLALAPDSAADPDLGAALARYRALEYRAAAPLLEAVLAKPGLADADRQLALAYLGRTRAALRNEPAAIDAFVRLLELDPAFELNTTESPLFRAALNQARKRRAISINAPSGHSVEPARASVVAPETRPMTATTTPDATDQTRQRRKPDDAAGSGWFLGAAVAGGVVAVAAAGALALLIWQPWTATADGNLGRWELP